MIITIGRQLGSGGREAGKQIAEALNMAYFDKEIIEETAKESGFSKHLFEQADEQAKRGFHHNFFTTRFAFFGDGMMAYEGLSNETLFRIQSDVIRSLADRQPSVFIGRCADYILRERKDCLSVFISANREDRIKRIIHYSNVSEEKAIDMIANIDKKRAAYYNYYTNKTWGMASSYDLCLNSSVFGIDGIVNLLMSEGLKVKG